MLAIVLAFFSTSAHAQSVCAGPDCAPEAALRAALLDTGLSRIDALHLRRDAAGQLWADVISTDTAALDRLAPRSGTRTTPLKGTTSSLRSVPVSLTDIDTITIGTDPLEAHDYLLEIDGIKGDDGGGGGGGGSTECTEVCVCTEDGVECWLEC